MDMILRKFYPTIKIYINEDNWSSGILKYIFRRKVYICDKYNMIREYYISPQKYKSLFSTKLFRERNRYKKKKRNKKYFDVKKTPYHR